MTDLEILMANLFAMELPDLIKLGKAILDAIEQKGSAGTVANAAVVGEEAVANAMEASKFSK